MSWDMFDVTRIMVFNRNGEFVTNLDAVLPNNEKNQSLLKRYADLLNKLANSYDKSITVHYDRVYSVIQRHEHDVAAEMVCTIPDAERIAAKYVEESIASIQHRIEQRSSKVAA